MIYKALNGLDNDLTGHRFEIGDEFDNDVEKFDNEVIDMWTWQGYIEPTKPKPKAKAKKKVGE